MKNDTETTVNVDRIRPYSHGVDSIEDQHQRDIELASHELSVINNTIRDLTLRQRQLLNARQIATTGRDIERQVDEHEEMKYPEVDDARDNDDAQHLHDDGTQNDELYDDDDSDEDESSSGIRLTNMDFIMLW